jgi:hypothetical protein
MAKPLGENVDVTHKPEDEFTIAAAQADVWVVSPEGEEHEARGVHLK